MSATSSAPPSTARAVLLADLPAPLGSLIAEWLADARLVVASDTGDASADLLLVELPFPRQAASERLRALSQRWPGVPVLAISPAFFAGVPSRGELARSLGVAAVLPMPVSREALLATVFDLVGPPPP